jgi:hypothetical protein
VIAQLPAGAIADDLRERVSNKLDLTSSKKTLQDPDAELRSAAGVEVGASA